MKNAYKRFKTLVLIWI